MTDPTRYSLLSYGTMAACEPRMSAYAAAMRQTITPGCTLIDLGSGPGILALLACKLGAGRVIAIEPDESIQLLRQLAADNGCTERLTIFQGLSTKLEPPEKAHVIVSDLRGCLPLFEHHVATIIDARQRLLAANGSLIPARDTLRIALVESSGDHAIRSEPWASNNHGLDLSAGSRFAVNSWTKVNLGADALLTEPAELAVLDYYRISSPNLSAEVELEVSRAGPAHALAVWFDTELAPGVGFSNAPGEPPLIYGQAYLPLERAVDVAKSDRIIVQFTAALVDGSYVWGWNTSVYRDGRGEPEASFRQSTFFSKIMSPQSLQSRSSNFVPPSVERHAIDRLCLSLVDGRRSLGEIAARVRDEYRERFATPAQALDYVVKLTARHR